MPDFDTTQTMPALLSSITAMAGDQNPAAEQLGPMTNTAKSDYFERNDEMKASRDRYLEAAKKLTDVQPSKSESQKYEDQINSLIDPDSPDNQSMKAQMAQLQQQLQQPISIPQQLRDKMAWIDARQQAAYSGHGKFGMAAQFLQDMLRRPGTPSGREAVYKMANDEYDKAVKDALEQSQAQKSQAASQLQLLSQQRLQRAQTLATLAGQENFKEKQRVTDLSNLDKGTSLILNGMKLDEAIKTDDAKLAIESFDRQYGSKPSEQILPAMIADCMATGRSNSACGQNAAMRLAVIEAMKKAQGSTSTSSVTPSAINAQGQITPEVTNRVQTPNFSNLPGLMNFVQQLQGQQPLGQSVPAIPSPGQSQPPQTITPRRGLLTQPNGPSPSTTGGTTASGQPFKLANGNIANPLAVAMGNLAIDPNLIISKRKGHDTLNQQYEQQAKEVWDARPWDTATLGPKPDWSTGLFAGAKKADNETWASGGKQGTKAQSINIALRHVALLDTAIEKLNNGDTKAFNWLANTWNTQAGGNEVTGFESIADRLGKEIASAYVAGGGVGREREAIEKEFSAAQSPKQLYDRVLKNLDLLEGATKSMQTSYYRDTLGKGTRQIIQPELVSELAKIRQQATAKVEGGKVKTAEDFLKKYPVK